MREIVHLQVGQCGNQIGSKVINYKKYKKKHTHTSIYKTPHYCKHLHTSMGLILKH